MPHRSSAPMGWRLRKARYSLAGTVCSSCGAKQFPQRTVCPSCGSVELEAMQFKGAGVVESYTTIHVAPSGFAGPYSVALVRLDEGPLIAAEVVDDASDGLEIGKRVRAVFRKCAEDGESGLIYYGTKFELAE